MHLTLLMQRVSSSSAAGAIVTGLAVQTYEREAKKMRDAMEKLGIFPAALLPLEGRMQQTSMAEVAEALDARVMHGHHNLNVQFVQNVEIATKQVPDLIRTLQEKPGTLIVTSAARAEVLLSILLAARSTTVPMHPGVLLTGAQDLPDGIERLLSGLDMIGTRLASNLCRPCPKLRCPARNMLLISTRLHPSVRCLSHLRGRKIFTC